MNSIPESRRIGPGTDNVKEYEATYTEGGKTYRIVATVSHDDHCKNGHNSFSMTAVISRWSGNVNHGIRPVTGRWIDESFGCQLEEIVKHFPELAPYVKWHRCSTDGPPQYLANTLFHARDLDPWGRRAGEPYRFSVSVKFSDSPIRHRVGGSKFMRWLREVPAFVTEFEVVAVENKLDPTGHDFATKYTFKGYREDKIEWYQCPFDTIEQATEWAEALATCRVIWEERPTAWGEGSTPDLNLARRSAIWPDGTLEDLQSKEKLEARLPGLLEEFKAAVESLGLVY